MDNKLAGALILTAFASGYGLCLYQAPLELPAVTVVHNAQNSSSSFREESFADVEFPEQSASSNNSSSTQAGQTSSASASASQNQNTSQAAAAQQQASAPSAPLANKPANQLSDEDIDQLMPKPFNSSLKKAHPDLKARYKDFADPGKPVDDWDMRMQSLLRDFIMSRPMATDIIIDSLVCRTNVCEIRLLENKKYLLLGLFGELMQQPWMANQVNGSVDFNPDNSNAFYMLLMRKPTTN